MQFGMRTLLWLVFGAALVAVAARVSSQYMVLVLTLFASIVGALAGGRRMASSCALAAAAGATALWCGLALHAMPLPWSFSGSSSAAPPSAAQEAYRQFVRDSFVTQSLFVITLGAGFGVGVAFLVWMLQVLRSGNDAMDAEPKADPHSLGER